MIAVRRLVWFLLFLLMLPMPAAAAVARLRIEQREAVAGGRAFGAAGPYEKLVGTV